MRRWILLFLFTILCLFQGSSSGAMDWKSLHEKADRLTLDEAITEVDRSEGSLDAPYVLGMVYLHLYKINAARSVFEQMMQIDPESVEAQWGLAEVLRRDHQLEEAKKLLRVLIEKKKDFPALYVSLGYLLFEEKAYDEAVALGYKVLKMGRDAVDRSNYVRAYLIIAGAKGMIASGGGPISKLINGTQVLPLLKKARSLQPDSAGVEFGLGSFYLLAPGFAGGDLNKASEHLRKAIEIDPLFADAYVRLAQACQRRGDRDGFFSNLARARELDPLNFLLASVEKDAR